MATLHMDVEAANTAQTNMVNTHQQLTQLLTSMTTSVTGLQSSWLGNSATEFAGLYDQWKSSMNTLLDNLNTMSTRLNNEIKEWDLMASKLA